MGLVLQDGTNGCEMLHAVVVAIGCGRQYFLRGGVGMAITTYHVKNMVCDRCIRVVREDFERLGYDVRSIRLGEVVAAPRDDASGDAASGADVSGDDALRAQLQADGFELLDDQRARLVEEVRTAVLRLVRDATAVREKGMKHSEWIERETGHEYAMLSALFSATQGITIERYIILQRIERAKELLTYGEMTVSEIAWNLGFSSTAHLSAQFRSVTGISPTRYRAQHGHERVALDKVGIPERRSP